MLEGPSELTFSELAELLRNHLGIVLSAERLARQLGKYGIYSTKRNARRVVVVSPAQIAELRSRYGIARPEAEPVTATLVLPAGQ